jgi:hypothetical protein
MRPNGGRGGAWHLTFTLSPADGTIAPPQELSEFIINQKKIFKLKILRTMKKFKFFALAAFAMLSMNSFAAPTDGTYLYSADGLDYSCEVSGTGTVFKATVVGLTTGNTSATSVTIPATLKPVGTGADANIKDQTFDVVAIAPGAFDKKTTLTSVTLTAGKLETIGAKAFSETGITAITLPATVKVIDDNAFAKTGLTALTIPAALTTLGEGFIAGTNITTLDLSPAEANLLQANIDQYAFESEKLTKVIFVTFKADGTPDKENTKITSITATWFEKSYALQEIVFPTTLTAFTAGCFKNTALTKLDLSKCMKFATFADIFQAKAKAPFSTLTSVSFPDYDPKAAFIVANTFAYCTGLTTLTFPTKWNTAATTYVAADAFKGCTGLTGVTFIPAGAGTPATLALSVSAFNASAFSDCTDYITITSNKLYVDLGFAAPTHCKYGEVTPGKAKEINLNNGFALLAQDDAWKVSPDEAVVYSVYVDGVKDNTAAGLGAVGDGTIYMVPFRTVGGYYQVKAGNEPVLVKAKDTSKAKLTIYQDAGIVANSEFVATALKRTPAVTSVSSIITADAGDRFVNVAAIANGVFGFTSPTASTLPAKTYYVLSEKEYGAAGARIVWLDESEATAIMSAKKVVKNDGAIYNLAGQKVNAAYKGVVIKDGKKYIQK